MKEESKNNSNRNKGKTSSQIREETLDGISDIISSDKDLQNRNIEFKTQINKSGDLEYHRYEDNNPNDTNPARLTGIFSQDQMDSSIQSRKDDPFYSYNLSKLQQKNVISDNEPDVIMGGDTSRHPNGGQIYIVSNGHVSELSL